MTIKSHERILMTGAAGNLGKQMRTRLLSHGRRSGYLR